MKPKQSIDSSTVLDYLRGVPWWKRLWNRLMRRWKNPEAGYRPPAPPAPPAPIRPATSVATEPYFRGKPQSSERRQTIKLSVPSGKVESVSDVLNEDARLRRKHGPIRTQGQPETRETQPVSVWQVEENPADPNTGPIRIARNQVSQLYAIVLQSPHGWLFWNGPKSKMFTRIGEGEIWTSSDRKIVLMTSNFLYSHGAAHAKKARKTKQR